MESCRAHFPALSTERNSKPPVYLDNACTTLAPRQVIDSINEYYLSYPACGGRRSHHWFANEVRDRIEGNDARRIKGSRRLIAEFINASSPEEIIFTSNTTHAINLVALGLFSSGRRGAGERQRTQFEPHSVAQAAGKRTDQSGYNGCELRQRI